MPNNGDLSTTLTPTGNNTATYTIPAGYTSGGTITANGATSYSAGRSDASIGMGSTSSGSKGTSQSTASYSYSYTATTSGYYVATVMCLSNGGDLNCSWSTTGRRVGSFGNSSLFAQNDGVNRGATIAGNVQTAIFYLEAEQSLTASTSARYADYEVKATTARLTVS